MSGNVLHSTASVPCEVDVLVVLGKQFSSIGLGSQDIFEAEDNLSYESRLNVTAAGMLWTAGRRILLSGNQHALFPQAAMQFLAKNFSNIPAQAYANPDINSFDTLASAQNVPPIIKAEGHKHPLLTTLGFHALRSLKLFEREHFPIDYAVAAENIVSERSPRDLEEVLAWKALPRVKLEEAWETVLRLDRSGRIGRLATNLLRP